MLDNGISYMSCKVLSITNRRYSKERWSRCKLNSFYFLDSENLVFNIFLSILCCYLVLFHFLFNFCYLLHLKFSSNGINVEKYSVYACIHSLRRFCSTARAHVCIFGKYLYSKTKSFHYELKWTRTNCISRR